MFKQVTTLAVATLVAGLVTVPVAEAAQARSSTAAGVTLCSQENLRGTCKTFLRPSPLKDVSIATFTMRSVKNTTTGKVFLYSGAPSRGRCTGLYRSVDADHWRNITPAKTVRCIHFT
ncbi:hypothetical protein [Streptomyces sp. NBRC 110028]|uniref:hypothetical protein n=1 Tax=Streptomyces sp. NBRC 110028 TaxID=1621260 RepID=UPI0006E3A104|nr:hypothetical protein [Streptomyces sp. NBRC 110028]